MRIETVKLIAATVAGGTIFAALAIVTSQGITTQSQTVAGSGASATGTNVQPTLSNMRLPTTTTEAVVLGNDDAPTSMSISSFSPTVKPSS